LDNSLSKGFTEVKEEDKRYFTKDGKLEKTNTVNVFHSETVNWKKQDTVNIFHGEMVNWANKTWF
jgi:hypothetical protein